MSEAKVDVPVMLLLYLFMVINNEKRGLDLLLKSGVEVIHRKIVKSGNIYELYEYENSVFKGIRKGNVGRAGDDDCVSEKDKNRSTGLRRARQNIRNIINSNIFMYNEKPKFITLTFTENIKDFEIANYLFMKFIKRLNYNVFGSKKAILKYTTVCETQKRGAVHYHCIFYNMPYVPQSELLSIWGYGGLYINAIEKVDNVGAYICKYLSKDTSTSLVGKKCYFNSRGLFKPQEITDELFINEIINQMEEKNLVYQNSYLTEYQGLTNYYQFNKNK